MHSVGQIGLASCIPFVASVQVGLCEEYSVQHSDEDFFHSRRDASDTDRGSDGQWFLAPPFYTDTDALMPILKRQQERLEKITSTPGLLPITRLNGTLTCLRKLDASPVHQLICLFLHVHVLSDAKAIIARLVHLAHHHEKVEEWSISPYASPRPRYTLPPLPAFRQKQVSL